MVTITPLPETENNLNNKLEIENDKMKKGFFFDMDGVLFDSMPNHARAWEIVMARHGLHFTKRDCYLQEGCTSRDVIQNAYRQQKPDVQISLEDVEAFYREKGEMFIELGGAKPMRGVYDVLKAIQAMPDAQIWVVTGSAQTTLLDQLNSAFPGIFARERMITAFECPHGKPRPEPYLKAWERSGLKKEECCVIENAPLGLQAARAADLFTIVVNTGPLVYEDFAPWKPDAFLPDMKALLDYLPNLV